MIWKTGGSSQGLGEESPLVGSRDKTTDRSMGDFVFPEGDDLLLTILQ